MSTIVVSRFELYPGPPDSPTCYCVGFSETYNGHSKYVDTQVPLDMVGNKSDEEIAHLAWAKVEPTFKAWKETVVKRAPIIGSIYTPVKRSG